MPQNDNHQIPVRLPDVAEQMGAPAEVPDTGQSAQAELPPFATFNAIATFDTSEEAREAILALERAGLDGSQLSFLGLDSSEQSLDERSSELDHQQTSFVARGTAKGGSLGSLGGAALGGAIMLIPGIGPIVGAGVLGAALGGGFFGGVLGGIWGGFNRMGASAAWEETFHHIQNGMALVGVHTDDSDQLQQACSMLPRERLRVFGRDGTPLPTTDD
jgi:hypothetical protein